ncbi:MAG: hypothetical protein ACXV2C_00085 [Candidatus Bathyarchaeia archaeon]
MRNYGRNLKRRNGHDGDGSKHDGDGPKCDGDGLKCDGSKWTTN